MNISIKNIVRIFVVVAIAALTVNVTIADDLNPPAYRGDPLSVWAHWQDPQDGTLDLNLTGFAAVDDVGNLDTFLDPSLPATPTASGPDYEFYLPNFIDKMPVKYMRLQVTWQADVVAGAIPAILGISGEESGNPVPGNIVFSSLPTPVVADGSILYQYHDIEFYPNPDNERWAIISPNAPLIQVVADTVSTVPEPATMALLGLGGLLLRKRR